MSPLARHPHGLLPPVRPSARQTVRLSHRLTPIPSFPHLMFNVGRSMFNAASPAIGKLAKRVGVRHLSLPAFLKESGVRSQNGRNMILADIEHQASAPKALHPSSFILSSIPYIPRSEYPISYLLPPKVPLFACEEWGDRRQASLSRRSFPAKADGVVSPRSALYLTPASQLLP